MAGEPLPRQSARWKVLRLPVCTGLEILAERAQSSHFNQRRCSVLRLRAERRVLPLEPEAVQNLTVSAAGVAIVVAGPAALSAGEVAGASAIRTRGSTRPGANGASRSSDT